MFSLVKYGTAVDLYTVLLTRGSLDAKDNPTLAAGDVQLSKDGGAYANITTLPSASPATSDNIKIPLSATELQCKVLTIRFKDQTSTAEWEQQRIILHTYGHASAMIPALDANMTQIDGQATSGNNATLNLKMLNIINSSGVAIYAESATSYGLYVYSSGGNGGGARFIGNGSGPGVSIQAGATGKGLNVTATAGNAVEFSTSVGDAMCLLSYSGHGLHAASATNGTGAYLEASGAGYAGLDASGKGTNGIGAQFQATTGGVGFKTVGAGTGAAFVCVGGATSDSAVDWYNPGGQNVFKLSTDGNGACLYMVSTGSSASSGLIVLSNSAGMPGIRIVTAGKGIDVVSSAEDAVSLVAGGSGSAIKATGGSSGHAALLTGGISGNALKIISQNASYAAVKIDGYGAGDAVNIYADTGSALVLDAPIGLEVTQSTGRGTFTGVYIYGYLNAGTAIQGNCAAGINFEGSGKQLRLRGTGNDHVVEIGTDGSGYGMYVYSGGNVSIRAGLSSSQTAVEFYGGPGLSLRNANGSTNGKGALEIDGGTNKALVVKTAGVFNTFEITNSGSGQELYLTHANTLQNLVTEQNIADAMKLAPAAGAPAVDSVQDKLDEALLAIDAVPAASEIDTQLSSSHGIGSWQTGGGLTEQQVRDAMKLAPSVGAADIDSIDDKIDTLASSTAADLATIEGKVDNVKLDAEAIISAINAEGLNITEILARIGVPVEIDGGAESLVGMMLKMIDDNNGASFDATTDSLNALANTEFGMQLSDTVDGVSLQTIFELIMSMANGRFKRDYPTTGDITFYKRDNATVLTVVNNSDTERTRIS